MAPSAACYSRRRLTASARGPFLAVLVLLGGTSCSLWESGKDLVFEEQPAAADPTPLKAVAPGTIQERYPFVRFLSHPDRTVTGVVTVPSGAAAKFVPRLKELCTMDDGAEPPPGLPDEKGVVPPPGRNPKLYFETDGGGVYTASAMQKPWEATQATWRGLEDLIFITGTESEVEEVLEALDLWYNASPQIEIRAFIMDVTNSELFERGIIQADGQPILENVDSNTFIRGLGGSFPSASNPGYGAGKGPAGLGGVFRIGFIDANFQLDAYLQFLKQEGVVDLVAQPSVVTRNGVPAVLTSTEEVPYLKPGAFALGGALTYSVEYRPIGVTLNVVPFLVGHDTLHLVISADASRIGREFIVGVDSNNNTISVPSTSKRSATTEVMVRSGQRVVIGGLRLREVREQTSKIPILGDIPILGWLFSNTYEEETTTDIYFVIEPTVKPVPTIEKIGDIFDPFAQ